MWNLLEHMLCKLANADKTHFTCNWVDLGWFKSSRSTQLQVKCVLSGLANLHNICSNKFHICPNNLPHWQELGIANGFFTARQIQDGLSHPRSTQLQVKCILLGLANLHNICSNKFDICPNNLLHWHVTKPQQKNEI